MNERLLLAILSSSFVAGIAGAYVGHWLTFRREKRSRLQQQRIEYLIGAYRAFAKASSSPRLWDVAEELEQAVADIQILGSPELIVLVQEFLKEFHSKKSTSVEGIVRAIRKDLRNELGEKAVSGEILRLRIERPPK